MRKILFSLLVLGIACGCGTQNVEVDLIPAGNRAPAKDFKASYLNSSDITGIEKLRGKVVILDFWATWCGPCRMEIPGLVKMYKDYHPRGLEVVGLSVELNDGQPKEFFDKFISENQMNYPVGLASMDTLKNYEISPIPATYFIDRNGKVALTFVGVHPEEQFTAVVEKLLAEK